MHLKHHIIPKWKKVTKKKIGAGQKGTEAILKRLALTK